MQHDARLVRRQRVSRPAWSCLHRCVEDRVALVVLVGGRRFDGCRRRCRSLRDGHVTSSTFWCVDMSMISMRAAHLSLTACRGSVATSFATRLPEMLRKSSRGRPSRRQITPTGKMTSRGASPRASRRCIRKLTPRASYWVPLRNSMGNIYI